MKKLLMILSSVAFALILAAGIHVIYLYHHREFGPKDFHHPFVLGLEDRIQPSKAVKQEAVECLSQPFTYLSHGGQSTVYESQDKKYVIKFFNPRTVIKKNWFGQFAKLRRLNSLKWITNTYFRQKQRLKKYFLRYELAFKDLKEETGLVYVHLDPSTCLAQTIELTDKEGNCHHIQLDAYPFVLQKKVELTMHHLDRLLKTGDVEEAKASVKQIYELFLSRARKGYTDRLQTLYKNYGFFEGRAVQLDVGRIRKIPAIAENPKKEMERVVSNINPSLAHYPELAPVLEECLKGSF
ncbi:MAG TPA: hypothetical protein VHK67_03965 [Rhabdochlamydiaceae bacterium]|jgi:hypothetical protein|nr:hypothetical protein [Rhabdochlamydiaceae bacterium]